MVVHMTSWMPSEARRKFYNTVAGKPSGTSLTVGSRNWTTVTGPDEGRARDDRGVGRTQARHHGPAEVRRGDRQRHRQAHYGEVHRGPRAECVGGATEGGLAGYFTNGTTTATR